MRPARFTGRGYAVRDAIVFIRSTPLLTSSGDNKLTAADGWVTYSLQPESDFPLKNGYNVQFFVKAYRKATRASERSTEAAWSRWRRRALRDWDAEYSIGG